MPARLEYEITGNLSGLAAAASGAKGILNNLQNTANQLNIKLFSAETVGDINKIGGALTIVNNRIQEYLKNAIQGSQAFKDQQAQNALDTLANKIQVLTGNAQIFGQSVKNSQAQINAYQAAINSLLSAGLTPFDDKIKTLKGDIDRLTSSIDQQKAAAAAAAQQPPITPRTLGLIEQAEQEVRDLQTALRQASSANDINALNQRLNATTQNLRDLRNIGNTVNQTVTSTGRAAVATAGGVNSFNLEIGRIVQDAPFAANNIGAIGNNITRAAEVIPQYVAGLRATIVAQGGVATSGAVARAAITSLFTGFSGIVLGISAVVTALTFYQQYTQKAKRETEDLTKATQEQEKQFDKTGYTKAVTDLSNLSEKIKLAKEGFLQKDKVLKEYNDTIGRTIGKVNDLNAAEQTIIDKGPAYLQFLLLKAKAQYAIEKAAAASYDAEVQQNKLTPKTQGNAADFFGPNRKDTNPSAPVKNLSDFLKDASGNAKGLSDNLQGAQIQTNRLGTAVQIADRKRLEGLQSNTQKTKDLAAESVKAVEIFAKANGFNIFSYDEDKQKAKNSGLERELSIRQQIENILAKDQNKANASGLSEYGKEVQGIVADYTDLNRQLTQVAQKLDALESRYRKQKGGITSDQASAIAADRGAITQGRTQLGISEAKRLNDAKLSNEKSYVAELQRINDAYGVKAQESRNAELAAVDAKANADIAEAKSTSRSLLAIQEDYANRLLAAKGNTGLINAATEVYKAELKSAAETAGKVQAIQNGRLVAQQAINDKYLVKERQLQDSIVSLNESALAELNDRQGQRTDRIVAEWDRRKVAAARYFDELRKIAPERAQQFNDQQQQLNALFDSVKFRKVSEELSKNFANAMQQGISSFASSFYTALTTLGEQRSAIDAKYNQQLQQATDESTRNQINNLRQLEQAATTSFGAVFSGLTASFFQSFNKSIFDSFTKRLTENLGTTIINPGNDLAVKVRSAGVDFSNIIKGSALSLTSSIQQALGVSGSGLSLAPNDAQKAAEAFNFQVTGASQALSATLNASGYDFSKKVNVSSEGISKSAAGLSAGASLLGGVLSGIVSKTSVAGQGLGGALSGAGTGALIGSAIPGLGTVAGGIIGGVVGAIGGIFGASKAKKEQQLQEQQLAEQKKQTEYLRQQNLAYTSAIIGRVTAEGTVTGVNIDAFGKLVAEVSGDKLQFVLDRTKKKR